MVSKGLRAEAGLRACGECGKAVESTERCDGRMPCAGYGTRSDCPPLIVLAVAESLRMCMVESRV
jgi:predicted metal-binding protein